MNNVTLLKNKEVIMWIFGDLTYLPKQDKLLEDAWGQRMLKTRRPDLNLDKQWTNKFGYAYWVPNIIQNSHYVGVA